MDFFKNSKIWLAFFVFVLAVVIYKTLGFIPVVIDGAVSLGSSLSPLLYASAIAFFMYPLCYRCEKLISLHAPSFIVKRARTISVVLVYVAIVLLISAIGYVCLPVFARSLRDFLATIPSVIDTMVKKLNKIPYIYIDLSQIDRYIDFKEFFQNSGWLDIKLYTSSVIRLSEAMVHFVLSLIASVYILLERKSLRNYFLKIINFIDKKGRLYFAVSYLKKGADFSYKYILCLFTDVAIMFVLSLILFLLLKTRHALVLALVVGIFNLFPYFGSVLAWFLVVITSLSTTDVTSSLILGISLLVLGQIDSNIIQPHLVKGRLDVSPLWVIVSVLVGGHFFGIWGILLSVPFVAVVKTIFADYLAYRHGKSGK